MRTGWPCILGAFIQVHHKVWPVSTIKDSLLWVACEQEFGVSMSGKWRMNKTVQESSTPRISGRCPNRDVKYLGLPV